MSQTVASTTHAAAPGFESVWAILQEVAQQAKETERRFQETDRRFQETDRRFQETDREIKELAREVKETSREVKETARLVRELRESTKELSRRFGDLGNRLGEFVEAMVEPSLVRLFRSQGLDVSEVHRRVHIRRGEEGLEIDLFVVDGDTAVAVECKSRLTEAEVVRHLERMNRLKRLMPAYAAYRIHGAVAGMTVDDEAAVLARASGLWVLAQSGETVKIANAADFEPRVW